MHWRAMDLSGGQVRITVMRRVMIVLLMAAASITLRRLARVALPVPVAVLLASCGNGGSAATKSDRRSRSASMVHAAPRPVLEGDGIGKVKFGQPPDVVAARLGRLFGPPVGANQIPNGYRHAFCGFYWEVWEGLGASSDDRFFVAELTVWFRSAQFVGYDYGPNNFQTKLSTWNQYARHPMMLATGKGLAVGDPLTRGQRLYGRSLLITTEMQGTPPNPRLIRLPVWEASTASGTIEGGIGITNLVKGTDGTSKWSLSRRSIVGIGAGVGPNTPCRCPCTQR